MAHRFGLSRLDVIGILGAAAIGLTLKEIERLGHRPRRRPIPYSMRSISHKLVMLGIRHADWPIRHVSPDGPVYRCDCCGAPYVDWMTSIASWLTLPHRLVRHALCVDCFRAQSNGPELVRFGHIDPSPAPLTLDPLVDYAALHGYRGEHVVVCGLSDNFECVPIVNVRSFHVVDRMPPANLTRPGPVVPFWRHVFSQPEYDNRPEYRRLADGEPFPNDTMGVCLVLSNKPTPILGWSSPFFFVAVTTRFEGERVAAQLRAAGIEEILPYQDRPMLDFSQLQPRGAVAGRFVIWNKIDESEGKPVRADLITFFEPCNVETMEDDTRLYHWSSVADRPEHVDVAVATPGLIAKYGLSHILERGE